MMKDAYSFDADAESFTHTYETMAAAYTRIFARMGLPTKKVLADNGYIGGEYCHEYIADCEAGESRYLETEDGSYCAHEDVAEVALAPMNPDEPIRPMQAIAQPAWVKTMDDNVKHYGQPAWRYLKNVVYKRIDTGELIIATIRGDLEVNRTKLEKAVGAIELLEEASDADLTALGTKPGYVHAWGHEATYVADLSLKTVRNFIGGQKENETDTIDVNYGRDFTASIEADIALAREGQMTADGKVLRAARGVEVGNIFQLGTHYTDKMAGAVYHDKDSAQKPFYMGCYGIGVGRTMATIVELFHDERGMIWPHSVAPFALHIVSLPKNDQVRADADALYLACQNAGIDVLYDDRDMRAGEKFADSDLIGIPTRVVVSEKSNAALGFEVVDRASGTIERLDQAGVIARGLAPEARNVS
jgi:prolyl-tRNA synthetase